MPMVAPALAQAPPSADACAAAKRMRLRWLRLTEAGSNLGSSRGRRAVLQSVTPDQVRRLCAGQAVSST
jgi:hypothetical protein